MKSHFLGFITRLKPRLDDIDGAFSLDSLQSVLSLVFPLQFNEIISTIYKVYDRFSCLYVAMLTQSRLDNAKKILSKIGRSGLVAKKVQVKRGGSWFTQTVFVKSMPDEHKKRASLKTKEKPVYNKKSFDAAYRRSLESGKPEPFEADFASYIMKGNRLSRDELDVLREAMGLPTAKDKKEFDKKMKEYKEEMSSKRPKQELRDAIQVAAEIREGLRRSKIGAFLAQMPPGSLNFFDKENRIRKVTEEDENYFLYPGAVSIYDRGKSRDTPLKDDTSYYSRLLGHYEQPLLEAFETREDLVNAIDEYNKQVPVYREDGDRHQNLVALAFDEKHKQSIEKIAYGTEKILISSNEISPISDYERNYLFSKLGEKKALLLNQYIHPKKPKRPSPKRDVLSYSVEEKIAKIEQENTSVSAEEAYGLAMYIGNGYERMNSSVRGQAFVEEHHHYAGEKEVGFHNHEGVVVGRERVRDGNPLLHLSVVQAKAARIALEKMKPFSTEGIRKAYQETELLQGEVKTFEKAWDSGNGLLKRRIRVPPEKIAAFKKAIAPENGKQKVIYDKGFLSTAITLNDVWDTPDLNVEYRIKHKGSESKGRFVDHYKRVHIEHEILFPPRTEFLVTKTEDTNNGLIIYMREI